MGLWGRYWFLAPGAGVFQELEIKVPPGPLIFEHSRLVTHYFVWPPLLAGGGRWKGVLNFPNSQEEKVHLGRGQGLPPWADRSYQKGFYNQAWEAALGYTEDRIYLEVTPDLSQGTEKPGTSY